MLLTSSQLFGQSSPIGKGTAFTGDLYHNGGYFGIGETAPQTKLHITADHNLNLDQFPIIRLENIYPKSEFENIWDIRNHENLYFDFGEPAPINTKMVLTKDGQLALGTETPHVSSILHLDATNKGLLIPKLTNVEMNAISTPANGLLIYNKDRDAFAFYESGSWHTITKTEDLDNYLTITDFNNTVVAGIENSGSPYKTALV